MLKVMFTKELGTKIRLMDLEFIPITTAVGMKDNGLTINSTEMELRNGQMVLNTRANMLKE